MISNGETSWTVTIWYDGDYFWAVLGWALAVAMADGSAAMCDPRYVGQLPRSIAGGGDIADPRRTNGHSRAQARGYASDGGGQRDCGGD